MAVFGSHGWLIVIWVDKSLIWPCRKFSHPCLTGLLRIMVSWNHGTGLLHGSLQYDWLLKCVHQRAVVLLWRTLDIGGGFLSPGFLLHFSKVLTWYDNWSDVLEYKWEFIIFFSTACRRFYHLLLQYIQYGKKNKTSKAFLFPGSLQLISWTEAKPDSIVSMWDLETVAGHIKHY